MQSEAVYMVSVFAGEPHHKWSAEWIDSNKPHHSSGVGAEWRQRRLLRAEQVCPDHPLQREQESPGCHDSTSPMALWIV